MDLSKNNQYDSRSETIEMGRKLHTAAYVNLRTVTTGYRIATSLIREDI